MCPEHFVEDFKKDRVSIFVLSQSRFVERFFPNWKWAMAMYIKMINRPLRSWASTPSAKLAEAKRGLTLLAGITGSGKSTTMAAMVMHLNKNFRRHCHH